MPFGPHSVGVKHFPEIETCENRAELIQTAQASLAALLEFLEEVPDEFLLAPAYPEGWTTAKNFMHSARTMRICASWIRAPRWLLSLRGGVQRPDMTPADVIVTNRPQSYEYGSYPEPGPAKPALRKKLVASLEQSTERLIAALNSKSDEDLKRLPGLFGGGNLLMFGVFAIKHGLHHINVSRIRLMAREA